jgi:hypothetical protein
MVLDASPVVVGEGPCAMCKGKGCRAVPMYAIGGSRGTTATARFGDLEGKMVKGTMTSCPECRGTGVRGEALDRERHVVMSAEGVVRAVGRAHPSPRETWDSAYRRHVCARADA